MTTPRSDTTAHGETILRKLAVYTKPVAPGVLARACGYNSSTALRHHMRPLLASGRVIETGKSNALRYALPPAIQAQSTGARPPIVGAKASSQETETELVAVWDGRKGSPSLTGGAAGLGSSLSGAHAIVGSRRR